MENIIQSLLETDLYKFSMGQAIYHNFPDYTTTWTFKCRNKDVKFTKEMVNEIKNQILAYCNLTFTEDELTYFNLRAKDKSNVQIAFEMNISESQVSKLAKRVKSKMLRVL